MRTSFSWLALTSLSAMTLSLNALSLSGCTRDAGSSSGDDEADCEIGDEGCACFKNRTCNADLTCLSEICVDDKGDDDSDDDKGDDDSDDDKGDDDSDDDKGDDDSDDDTADDDDSDDDSDDDKGDDDSDDDKGDDDSDDDASDDDASDDDASDDDASDDDAADDDASDDDASDDDVSDDDASDDDASDDDVSDDDVSDDDVSDDDVADDDVSMLCEPEQTRCNSTVVEEVQTCSADGTAWEGTVACVFGEGCNLDSVSCVTSLLVPTDGWLHRTENALGVQGAWYTYGDGIDSTEEEWSSGTGGFMCMYGVSGASSSDRPTGALQLCTTDADQTPAEAQLQISECPHGRLDEMQGVRVTFSGPDIPDGIRVMFNEPGRAQPAFVAFPDLAGDYDAWFSDAENLSGTPVNPSKVDQIQIQVPSSTTFDFCISDLQPLYGSD